MSGRPSSGYETGCPIANRSLPRAGGTGFVLGRLAAVGSADRRSPLRRLRRNRRGCDQLGKPSGDRPVEQRAATIVHHTQSIGPNRPVPRPGEALGGGQAAAPSTVSNGSVRITSGTPRRSLLNWTMYVMSTSSTERFFRRDYRLSPVRVERSTRWRSALSRKRSRHVI